MTALQTPRNRVSRSTPPPPPLRQVIAPGRPLASIPFIIVMALMMGVGMVGLLLLNTSLQTQAFVVRDQQAQASELGYQMDDLEARVIEARSSTQLGIRAYELGMRPDTHPVYLVLPDGTVIGDPTEVSGKELPSVGFRTPEQLRSEEEARVRAEAEAKAKAKAEAKARAKAKAEAEAKAKADAEAKAKADAEAKARAERKKRQDGNG